jgi:hypothetical protein
MAYSPPPKCYGCCLHCESCIVFTIEHHVMALLILLREIEDGVARLNQILEVWVEAFWSTYCACKRKEEVSEVDGCPSLPGFQHVDKVGVVLHSKLLQHVLPAYLKLLHCVCAINTSKNASANRLPSTRSGPSFVLASRKIWNMQHRCIVLGNILENAVSIAPSWSVIMWSRCKLSIASNHFQNTQLNISMISFGSKAHPRTIVCRWLFIPTIGAKGRLYLLVQKVMSKKTQSLYLG